MKIYSFIPGTIWFILVNILLLIPGKDLPNDPFLEMIYFDKWVHIGLFGMLTFLFSYPFLRAGKYSSKTFFRIMLICLFYGIAMEYVQKYFTEDRAFDIDDMIADGAGCVAAFYFIEWLKAKLNKANK